ncbi:hypothetical protein ACFVUH_30175 [Kitasatospora sp. NPDC058032]|uniref:hypothetical protein n=1 Tax=Kitasatospora sp. NPDC058032 TaxID=3346307 RepID=UPI0036DE32E0
MTTTDTISGYFDAIEWSYKVTGPNQVVTSYRCPVPAYFYAVGIEVVLGRHWIVVRALLQRSLDHAQRESVLQLVSQWNVLSYRARFVLIGDCVVVQAEIPAGSLSLDEFLLCLTAVCRYSTLAGTEIAAVATNPSLRKKLDEVIGENRPPAWAQPLSLADADLDFDITPNRFPDSPDTP